MSKSKTKLVSLSMGISLVVLKDGKEEKMSYSLRCPSKSVPDVYAVFGSICDYLNEEFGTEFVAYDSASEPVEIKIAKPKTIKAPAPVSQDEFNKRIKELVS